MQLSETDKMAMDISKRIREKFMDRVWSTQIYDVVDDANHRAFKVKFVAYNYFIIVFQYELDIIGCSIEYGKEVHLPIINEKYCYSDCDFNEFFSRVKEELELRIPDKFLKAKGWI